MHGGTATISSGSEELELSVVIIVQVKARRGPGLGAEEGQIGAAAISKVFDTADIPVAG
jgi:hypothetical protein